MTLIRAVRAFESTILAQPQERFLCHNMTARHHHWRVLVCSLFLGHWTDEDGVKAVGGWERHFDLLTRLAHLEVRMIGESYWNLVIGSPLGPLGFHDNLKLGEVW